MSRVRSGGSLLSRREMLLRVGIVCASAEYAGKHALGAEPGGLRWDRTSQLREKTSAAELRTVADDGTLDRRQRARSVFALFANYLRPPQAVEGMRTILGHPSWPAKARLDGVYALAGWIPVELTTKDTVFCLRLFPNQTGWSEWVVYFRLSGGRDRPVTDAEAFLSGNDGPSGAGSMQEFALCFPPSGQERVGRIERFSVKGVAVYPPW